MIMAPVQLVRKTSQLVIQNLTLSTPSNKVKKMPIPRNPKAKTLAFQLWIRLMDEKKYENLLFGDISAMIAFRRLDCLAWLLDRQDLHSRVLYGSDYPVPAVPGVVWTSKLRQRGLITPKEEVALDEIFHYSTLLFDFVTKRTIRSRNGKKFLPCVFQTRQFILNQGKAKSFERKEQINPVASSSSSESSFSSPLSESSSESSSLSSSSSNVDDFS